MSKMKLNPGFIYGNQLKELFEYCKENSVALPAINVISSSSINAALASAQQAKAPIIIQFSNSGAAFYAGKTVNNSNQEASIIGAAAGAMHVHKLAEAYGVPVIIHTDHAAKKLLPWIDGLLQKSEYFLTQFKKPLFSSHMLDLSEESIDENLEISASYLERMNKLSIALEIELGITGGEEDGVDNSHISADRLYTQAEDVLKAYDRLNSLGLFTVAASFGNTHGVYKPGNVVLRPEILKESQELVSKERDSSNSRPLNLVFHGGSGSEKQKIDQAVSYGVIKFNIDTDTQWAYTQPVKQYMDKNDGYLHSQIGNPDGADKPNKNKIDPRAWTHEAEKGLTTRLVEAFKDLSSFGKFDF